MTVRSCQDVVELVTSYLDNAMPTTERLEFERHVAICPPCRAYVSQIRKVVKSAGALHEDELPEHVRASLVAAFKNWHGGKR